MQIGYVWHLFSGNLDYVTAAAGVGSHFILSNLLLFAFVMLFVRGHSIWGEIILIINFFNLSSLYFRHTTLPSFIHIPVVSGPLAWNFVALYWNGAIAVNATGLAARILANVAIWAILAYGFFFLVTYKVSRIKYKSSHHLHFIGLYNGFRTQYLDGFHRRDTVLHQDHCVPMDLCFRHHGRSIPRNPGHCCARYLWKGDQLQERRPSRPYRPRESSSFGRALSAHLTKGHRLVQKIGSKI
jgi:hypothetical protein